ncbi:MAG TPA: response regulator [Polyangiaceae bacterium]|jgi:signal transduction histidine kinase|nr:response regulator [Polyangiaceae bacterium]
MASKQASPSPDELPEVEPTAGDILVVDDNAANLVAIQAALGDFEGGVVRAQSGTEALGLLLERDFALILLDVKMPSMDGFETARMIRSRKRSRHTPIIFVTAHGRDDQDILAAYQLGAVDFMFKPLAAEVLRAKVSVFVELQRRSTEIALQADLLREAERREHVRSLDEERRRWEADSLRRQMEELESADRRKDEFLAFLGHELRNPLTPIVAGLELVRQKLSMSPDADASLIANTKTMQRQARHLTRLVDDLLDISRINSGKIELRSALTTIQDVVEQAVTTSRPLIDERKHELVLEMPRDPLIVRGDGVRLIQAVANLLNNAARYTEPGGKIRVQALQQNGMAEIHVFDNGSGIAPEFLPRIFEMFVQERDSTAGGLGLGLSLASRLIGMHGGTIGAFSEGPGHGSEFVVKVPLDETADASDVVVSTRPPPAMPRSLVIALVDDNPDVRDMMQQLLSLWGHQVQAADRGEAGIELILRLKPHVAFVDIGLPDLDGYTVARRVRKDAGDSPIRLIAMTGFGRDSDRRKAQQAGFDLHLPKPADIDALKKALAFEEA